MILLFASQSLIFLYLKEQDSDTTISLHLTVLIVWMRLQIGVKGAEAIADCLLYNATISTLDLRANSLGDDVWT